MKFKSTEISLQFKVWCPIFNRVKHRLFILGSLHELGAWNIYDALEAHPTPDNHTWQVDVIVPSGSSFEWVWLRTNLNRTGVEWERSTKRNRTVGYFSGVIHSIWANSEEVYLQSATFAEITTYTNVNDGYTLVLSGSTPTTGLWNLANAVQATEFPKKSGYWKVHVSFDALTNLEFQWAIVKEKDFTSVGAMEEMKHSITGRRGWMRVVAPWMVPVAGIVDIAIKNDTLDNAYGRTSILVKERQNRKEEITAWINSWNKNYAQANRQRHLKQSVSEESKTSDRTKVSDITIDPILTRQPAVRSNENLDELIQKTQERIFKESNTERFTKQLSEGYTEKCDTLKGQGQIDVPSDPINSDALNGGVRQKGQGLRKATSADLRQVHDDHYQQSDNEIVSSLEEAISEGTNSTITQTAAEGRSDFLSDNDDFCHVSSSMAHFVASDTGFTEMATSWMSSMTNVPRPSSTLTSQLDVPLLSTDLDEGFSEADVTLVSTLVNQHAHDAWSQGSSKQAIGAGTKGQSKQNIDSGTQGPSKQAIDAGTQGPSKQAIDAGTQGQSKQNIDAGTQGPSKQAIDSGTHGLSKQAIKSVTQGPSKPAIDAGTNGPSKQSVVSQTPGSANQAPNSIWSTGPGIADKLDNFFPFFSMNYDEELHQMTSAFYEDVFVNIEDRLHLEWLAERIQLEEHYCTNTLWKENGKTKSILNIGSSLPFSTILEANNMNPDETLRVRWTKPNHGTPPVCGVYREETTNSSSYDGFFSQDHEKLCGPSCDLSDARAIAREMEERWGAGLSLTDASTNDVHEKFLLYRESRAFFGTYETNAQQLDIEDRRAIAREIESSWCQSAV